MSRTKRYLAFAVAAMMVLLLVPVSVSAANENTLDTLTYSVAGGASNVTVNGFTTAAAPGSFNVDLGAGIADDATISIAGTATDTTATLGGTTTGTFGVGSNTLTLTITVTPASGSAGVGTYSVVFSRTPATPPAALALTDSPSYDVPASTVGTPISGIDVAAAASGGTAPYTFSLENTSGCAWLSITNAGLITGTPTAPAGATTATVKVTDSASATATMTIDVGEVTSGTTPPAHVPVTGIINVNTITTVGTPLLLSGTVQPADATNQTIVWSLKDAGTANGSVSGNSFSATAAGNSTVTATIAGGGATAVQNYSVDIIITVDAAPSGHVAVTGITGIPATTAVGSLTLNGVVAPTTATYKAITWSIASAGTTNATISGTTLTTRAAGTVVVRATIANGTAVGTPFIQTFNITVTAAGTYSMVSVGRPSGTPQVGQELTAGALDPSGATVRYQWQYSDTNTVSGTWRNISGATGQRYTISGAYFGKYLRVAVTGTGSYKGTVYSEATTTAVTAATPGPVAPTLSFVLTGTPQAGVAYTYSSISASPADVKNSLSYQWSRSTSSSSGFTNIAGATARSYTPTSSDVGYYLQLEAYGNGAYSSLGSAYATSPAKVIAASYNPTVSEYYTDASHPLYNSEKSIWIYPSGGSAYYASLYTSYLSGSSSDYKLLQSAAGGQQELCAYEIKLYNPGNLYGPYSLSFNLTTRYANQTVTVLHKLSSGLIEKFTVVANSKGYATISTRELSPFMVVLGTGTGGTVYVPSTDVPKTGSGDTAGIIGLMIAVFAIVAAAFLGRAILRRRQEQE